MLLLQRTNQTNPLNPLPTMKKTHLLTMLLLLLVSVSTPAENYPYRSDYLWVTVPDHANWLYKTGEHARVEVQF